MYALFNLGNAAHVSQLGKQINVLVCMKYALTYHTSPYVYRLSIQLLQAGPDDRDWSRARLSVAVGPTT